MFLFFRALQKASKKDERLKELTLKDCGMKWRRFKSELYNKYVKPVAETPELYKHPPPQYDFITQEVWDEFVSQRLTYNYKVFLYSCNRFL